MNFAYLHLAVNHIPIVGIGIALLLLLVALWRKDDGMFRAGLVVVVLSGLGAILAVQSGERAEEQLERVVAMDESLVEAHEEAAETAQWLALAAAALAFVTFFGMGRLQAPVRWLKAGVVVATVLVLIAVLRTAKTGGPIRHPEVQGGPLEDPDGTVGGLSQEDEGS